MSTASSSELPYGLTPDALAAATAEADPDALGAATRLRARFGPELAAAALHQVSLRRQARTKFGAAADTLFLTRTGLEQATRPEVAAHHAARFAAAGARRVVDLGCGIGTDSAAFLAAGLSVLAVDLDPGTAAVARVNLHAAAATAPGSPSVEVRCADAVDVIAELGPDDAVFADPARRNDRGRVWQVADFTPDLSLVTALMDGRRTVGVKLGPALPHRLVPAGAEAEWVSHRGDVVEAALWSGPASEPGRWSALLWPDRRLVADDVHELVVLGPRPFLYEPDGAVIRAGAVATLGAVLGAGLLAPQIAYLSAETYVPTPFATAYEVLEVLAYDRRTLRRWVREHGVGTLEIKKRGLDVDPAALRRELKPSGPGRATLVLSRSAGSALALVVRRVVEPA